jgi:hypothetical protein
MKDYFEVITNAITGEQIIRPYTQSEIDKAIAEEATKITSTRATMVLSFSQLLVGLVTEQWITTIEGELWLQGILPAAVTSLIATLPTEQQFIAKARATRPSEVYRLDSLVIGLATAQNITAEQLDEFFKTYSQI